MTQDINIDYKAGWADPENYTAATDKGLNEQVVREISAMKNEPEWMLDFRLKSLRLFESMPTPSWADKLVDELDFQKIRYYVRYSDQTEKSWDDVPDDIKETFDKLGIPEAERKFLAGVGAQYDSETVYHKLREDLEEQGVIFLDTTATYVRDWHNAPHRQFMIVLEGEAEIEIGDGTKRRLGAGDILLAEDITGHGHITRNVGNKPRKSVIITLE